MSLNEVLYHLGITGFIIFAAKQLIALFFNQNLEAFKSDLKKRGIQATNYI